MGRWVILSNNKDIRNSAKKRENKDESTDRNVHRQTTSSKARSQHVSLRIPRYALAGDKERVMMRTPAANLAFSHCVWSSTTTLGATPSSPLYSNWSRRSSSEISCNQLSNTFYRCACPETHGTRDTSLTMLIICQVFAQQHPRYLLRIVNKHEEFYALLMFFVERYYLKTYGNQRVLIPGPATR
jgi:hypothetical protein